MKNVVENWLEASKKCQQELLRSDRSVGGYERYDEYHAAMEAATNRRFDRHQFADRYAQAVVCAQTALRDQQRLLDLIDHAGDSCGPFAKQVLVDARDRAAGLSDRESAGELFQPCPDAVQFTSAYEFFLEAYDRQRRTRRGVYYTPPEIASFIVRRVHRILQTEFGLADGLADTSTWGDLADRHTGIQVPSGARLEDPFVQILDPAVGTGIFMLEVVGVVHRTMVEKWRSNGVAEDEIDRLWNSYVPRHLLPRLHGVDVMLPPVVIAQLAVIRKLLETGYQFGQPGRLQLYLGDSLSDPFSQPSFSGDSSFRKELEGARRIRGVAPITIVLGNPPFSGISLNDGAWIRGLLRGQGRNGQRLANYYEVNGEPLGERKVWLQDDYVKFLRYAHWRIEACGYGCVGFVTNHGYLDNVTFRGARQQMSITFPRISTIDLHGNSKKKEVGPGGVSDENVFAIKQGVAVGLLRRSWLNQPSQVTHCGLWGTREDKLALLANELDEQPVQLEAPFYFLTPGDNTSGDNTSGDNTSGDNGERDEYARAYRLSDIMPVHSTAPVTARDGFVTSVHEAELIERLELFRDLRISDDEIRNRFFNNSRSSRYPPGDTRGWKLSEARRRMSADKRWRERIRPCLYRPFDRRPIFWTDWMIDWPRAEITSQLKDGTNLALVARRQMLPTHPCNYFWVTDIIAIDGVIRSDNRGSESVFPLFVQSEATERGTRARRSNFASEFVQAASRKTSLSWQEGDRATGTESGDANEAGPQTNLRADARRVSTRSRRSLDLTQPERRSPSKGTNCFGPRELFFFIYAQFHSNEYRRRYARFLRVDFPRVFLPCSSELFMNMARLGSQLVKLHLLADDVPEDSDEVRAVRVGRGFPKHEEDAVLLNQGTRVNGVPREVWEFRVGGHQVCRKWLKDRRNQLLGGSDLKKYGRIVAAVANTIAVMKQVDACIRDSGGWRQAFLDETAQPEKSS